MKVCADRRAQIFELAVAATIGLFGFESATALAGVLIEVPVMRSVVYLVNRSRGWYEATNS